MRLLQARNVNWLLITLTILLAKVPSHDCQTEHGGSHLHGQSVSKRCGSLR